MPDFNKEEFGRLLEKAKGERSINTYAMHSGVDSAHISRLIRGMVDRPPTPQTIKKLSDNAHNDITYKDLMIAAGHYDKEEAEYLENRELMRFIRKVFLQKVDDNDPLENVSFIPPDVIKKLKELRDKEEYEEMFYLIREKVVNRTPAAFFEFLTAKALKPQYNNWEKRIKDESTPIGDFEPLDNVLKVPVIGHIAAGHPIFADEHIDAYMVIPNPDGYKQDEVFILEVKGDSMEGSRIHEGDRVVVKIQPEVENGEIAVVNVNGDEATLKKVKRYEDGSVWLISTNPKYAPIPLNNKKARIIGKVVQVIFEPA